MSDYMGQKGIGFELDHILEAMDDTIDVSGTAKLVTDDTVGVIHFTLWESLAYDLALGTASHAQIASGYKVTLIQLQELIGNPHFKQLLEAKQKEVSKLGDGAGFTVAFRMIANKGIESFMARVTSAQTPDKEFLNLFKTAVELGQLKPEEDPEHGATPLGGPSVAFHIYGVPGLEHLTGAPPVTVTPKPYIDMDVESGEDDAPIVLERL